jgi:YbbR domain-containing protein
VPNVLKLNESTAVGNQPRRPAWLLWRPRRITWRWRLVVENLATALLATVISLSVWIVAINEQNPPREDFLPVDLPIEISNKPADLVLFQPFERTIRVRIRASQASWDRLQPGTDRTLAGNARAFIDLAGTTAGLHEYEVQVKFADPDITIISLDPQSVSLRLEEQREKPFGIQVNISDAPPVGFTVGTPETNPPSVTVSGPQSSVDQVVEVIAAVQLRGTKTAIDRDVALIARDAQGNSVQGIRLSPESASVHVPVDQRLGFKDVSIKVVTKGTVASGYWLSNITVDPSTLTVVGSPARLDEIGGFVTTDAIDVKDARSGFVRPVTLVMPPGVSPVTTQSVQVTIDVAAITGGQTVQRQIIVKGLDKGLKATLSPDTIDVILGGPLPILQTLKPDDVQVVIDLGNKTPGKYKISPTVIKPDSLKVESIVPDTIEVSISK